MTFVFFFDFSGQFRLLLWFRSLSRSRIWTRWEILSAGCMWMVRTCRWSWWKPVMLRWTTTRRNAVRIWLSWRKRKRTPRNGNWMYVCPSLSSSFPFSNFLWSIGDLFPEEKWIFFVLPQIWANFKEEEVVVKPEDDHQDRSEHFRRVMVVETLPNLHFFAQNVEDGMPEKVYLTAMESSPPP